ncbi:MAG: hypothetical protein ABW298_09215 [Candidatus Binatia bacterium]
MVPAAAPVGIGDMADERESRLRRGSDVLKRLGISAEDASIEQLEGALDSDPETALAVAERCGALRSVESATLLARIEREGRQDKLLRREARRSLYRLKQKGIEPNPQAAPEVPGPRPALGGPDAEGLLSFGDAAGDRLVWILKPRPGGGLLHLSTVVNEPAGLKEAVLAEVRRKSIRGLREELRARHGLRLIEVDWRYCDWISAEGYERARQRGAVSESVARYPQLRLQLFAFASKPFATVLRPSAADAGAQLPSSASLYEEPELQHWILGEEMLGPYLARYREIRNSPIVLDRPAQLARLEEIVQDALGELFAGEGAASWRRRLDETAFFFDATGRPAAAQRAAAVVAELGLRNTGRGIPFCEELVRRSFGIFFAREAEREREEKAGSVLVTPDDIRAEQARARGRTRGR